MKNIFSTKSLCRAGVIAALYVAVTCAFGELAFTPMLQIRPAEALCILPLFFPEAVPALYVGCMLANLFSQYGPFDIFLGSLATLLAGLCTWGTGKLVKNDIVRVIAGGVFPVLLNAFILPAVWMLAGVPDVVYWAEFAAMVCTEALWVYVLGIPLYFAVLSLRKKGVKVFLTPQESENTKKK